MAWGIQEHTEEAKEDPEHAELPTWKRLPAKLKRSSPEELVCQSQAEMPDPLHQNSRGFKGPTANASVTVQRSRQASLVEDRKNCLSLSHSPGNTRFHSIHTVRSPNCTKLGNTRCPPTHPQVYCNILNFRLQPSREDIPTA